jgi:hypothetical protein
VRRAADRHSGRVRTGWREDGDGPAGEARTPVSLVTFDPSVAGEQAMRLIELLDRLVGPAVPRVLDVAEDRSDGPVVVLEFCGETVASILAAGTGLAAGEVVTLVAPILAAVHSLHDRGFSHGGLSVASVSIGVGGRPLLLGVERAIEFGDDGRDRERAARDDLLGIADVLVDLSAAVRDPGDRRRIGDAAGAIRSGAASPFSSATRATAEVRLFEIAVPVPVVFAGPIGDAADERRPLPPVRDVRRRRTRESRSGARAGLAEAGMRLVTLTRRLTPRRPFRDARPTGARRRRGPVVLGAVIVVGTLVALILVPRGSGGGADGAPEPAPTTEAPKVGVTTDGGRVTSDVGAEGGEVEPAVVSTDGATDVVVGTRAVLDAAAACVVSREDDCWGELLEPGTALAAELEATDDPLSALPSALALPVDAVELRPRDDYGDARVVLVVPTDGTRPASVLMIRTEAGWRLRDAFDA